MNKIVVISDSFKGTMTSNEVCDIEGEILSTAFPECEILKLPIADGGEGTVECFLRAMSGEKIALNVKDAYGNSIKGYYGRFKDLAVIEMAQVAGIISNSIRNPMMATTFGVGQLIDHAISSGCKKILIGLGGSCTNDGGVGMAAALGTRFLDIGGKEFLPTGGNLDRIKHIDNTATEKKLKEIEVSCMCDIKNPLYGEQGAAYVFAPQKGANARQVKILDENLRALARVVSDEMNIDISSVPGGGAAGGMGAGAKAFLNAELRSGIDFILDTIDFENKLKGADYVITGEGKLDKQSLGGKVVKGIYDRAESENIPVITVVGTLAKGFEGIGKVYVTSQEGQTFEEICRSCRDDLRKTMQRVAADMQNS